MDTIRNVVTIIGSRSMGHMFLHYERNEEEPLAARLFKLLGFV